MLVTRWPSHQTLKGMIFMSVANETPTMQVRTRTSLQIAKACDKLQHMDEIDKRVQTAEIALSESATGRRIDYVCKTGEILEDVVKDLLPEFEIEPQQCTSEYGNRTVTEEFYEVAWNGSGIVVVDATAMPPEYIDRTYSLNDDRAEITATCTAEAIGGKLLVTISYEGVACG